MLTRCHNRCFTNCGGAVMVEFALIFVFIAILLAFMLETGIALHHRSRLADTTTVLTRHLGIQLGIAFFNNSINQLPWEGSCNSLLIDVGNDYLESVPGEHSMNNLPDFYYYGATINSSTAIVTDPNSPYAILRIQGTMQPTFSLGRYILPSLFTVESSTLVEYPSMLCSDY